MSFIIFLLWLADVLQGLSIVAFFLGLGFVISGTLGWINARKEQETNLTTPTKEQIEVFVKSGKKRIFIGFVIFFVSVFVPTKTIIYLAAGLIIGENAIEKIANTEKFVKINQIIELKLDEILDDLQKGKD